MLPSHLLACLVWCSRAPWPSPDLLSNALSLFQPPPCLLGAPSPLSRMLRPSRTPGPILTPLVLSQTTLGHRAGHIMPNWPSLLLRPKAVFSYHLQCLYCLLSFSSSASGHLLPVRLTRVGPAFSPVTQCPFHPVFFRQGYQEHCRVIQALQSWAGNHI